MSNHPKFNLNENMSVKEFYEGIKMGQNQNQMERIKKITGEEWDNFCKEADKRMKENNGHEFVITFKTRCQLCGRSPRQKGKCRFWFKTYLDKLYSEVNNYLAKTI